MADMFYGSKFNGDISQWDVSNVKDMIYMFDESKFNGDISKWNVSNVEDMECMFSDSKFNGAKDLVEDMSEDSEEFQKLVHVL